MSFQAEIKGKSAHFYRAYGPVKLLRSPNYEDIADRVARGLGPYPPRSKIQYVGDEPVMEGAVDGEAITINVPKGKSLTRVVFYKGDGDEQFVVGSLDLDGNTGKVAIEFVEPKEDPSKPVIFEAGGGNA